MNSVIKKQVTGDFIDDKIIPWTPPEFQVRKAKGEAKTNRVFKSLLVLLCIIALSILILA